MRKYSISIGDVAMAELLAIEAALEPYSAAYAMRIYGRISRRIRQLGDYPHLGPVYRAAPDYRLLVADDWLILYRVDEEREAVRIYRILYGRADAGTQMETDE